MISASGRSTPTWSVIVLAFDGPTPMLTMLTPSWARCGGARPASGARAGRALGVGEALAERLDVHGVVREQHVALERLGRRARVVRQPVERQRDPLGPEQEQLLRADVPLALVDRGEQRRRRPGRAPGGTAAPRTDAPRRSSAASSRSRYQRMAPMLENSPVMRGFGPDHGPPDARPRRTGPPPQMASMPSSSRRTAASTAAGLLELGTVLVEIRHGAPVCPRHRTCADRPRRRIGMRTYASSGRGVEAAAGIEPAYRALQALASATRPRRLDRPTIAPAPAGPDTRPTRRQRRRPVPSSAAMTDAAPQPPLDALGVIAVQEKAITAVARPRRDVHDGGARHPAVARAPRRPRRGADVRRGHGRAARSGRRAVPRPGRDLRQPRASARSGSATDAPTTSTAASWTSPPRPTWPGGSAPAASSWSATASAARWPSTPAWPSAATRPAWSAWPPSRPAARSPSCSRLPCCSSTATADELLPPMASEVVRMIAGHGELDLIPGAGHLLREAGDHLREKLGAWIPERFAEPIDLSERAPTSPG